MFTLEVGSAAYLASCEILNHQLMFWEGASAKVLPAGFLTPFCEHFEQELLGGKRERLPDSLVSKSVRARDCGGVLVVRVQKGDRWADWWIFCIGNPRQGSGEITNCWGDQASTCRPSLHLQTPSGRETALSPPPPIAALVTLWSAGETSIPEQVAGKNLWKLRI